MPSQNVDHFEVFSPKVTFFVPCLNEEKNVERTLDCIQASVNKFAFNYEVIVVDDGSTDKTYQNAREHRISDDPRCLFKVKRSEKTLGLGYQYTEASLSASGEYFMLINGDNVETVSQIVAILNKMGEAEIIIPFFGKNDTRTWFRKFLSRLFTCLTNWVSGQNIKYFNGAILHKTENLRSRKKISSGYAYQAMILVSLLWENKTYLEVEVRNSDRIWGFSKAFKPKNFLSVFFSLNAILLKRIQRKRLS